ncbi:TAP-like protein-domain-containing protein [Xylariales sp. PMI_506]|nr:TAP-like protein-domain-containing protein [Xylariales sp. PMI_506]
MEKREASAVGSHAPLLQKPRRTHNVLKTVCAGILASAFLLGSTPVFSVFRIPRVTDKHIHESEAFDWLKIEPTQSLVWQPCWDPQFHCARLDVPMNWNDTANPPARVQVAIVKLPAPVPVTDERYGGALLVNPGGPGGSGLARVLAAGTEMQRLTGPGLRGAAGQGGKFYDIISFDPRGVNSTTPHLTCFPDGVAGARWLDREPSNRLLGDDRRSLDKSWAQMQAVGMACAEQREGDEPNVVSYVNTPQVAEDMLAIVEAHGEWREAEAKRLLSCPAHRASLTSSVDEVLEQTKWQQGAEKINYWGFSYGTLLGQTFAALHPDRINRLVIDGNLDMEDYYWGKRMTNLQDTDGILGRLSAYCAAAGAACPFYREGSAELGPNFLWTEIESTARRLLEDPIPALTAEGAPVVIDQDGFLNLIQASLYQPYSFAEPLMRMLSDMQTGKPVTRLAGLVAATDAAPRSEACAAAGPFSPACEAEQDWELISNAVLCSDGPDVRNGTKEDFLAYMDSLAHQSAAMGENWSRTMRQCMNWPARAAWPFLRESFAFPLQTSHPLLIVGNAFDPVTPIRNGRRAAELFPGAVVLEVDIEGHCSFANPSVCAGRAIRRYFQDGSLPEPGTVCAPETRPWLGCVSPAGCEFSEPEDAEMWQVVRDSTRAVVGGPLVDMPK